VVKKKAFDFNNQERIVRGRMPTLEMVNEHFTRYFRVSLFNFLRRSAEISVSGIKIQKFSEYVQGLFVPTNLNIIRFKPLRQCQ
jgi:flagellar motor switch protein FliM